MNRVLIFTFITYLLLRSMLGIRYVYFGPISEVTYHFLTARTQPSCHDAVPQKRSYIRNEYAMMRSYLN